MFVGLIAKTHIAIVLYGKPTNSGERYVYLQWTKNRSVRRASLKKMALPKWWDGTKPDFYKTKGKDTDPNFRFKNLYLNNILNEGERILLMAETMGDDLSWVQFKARLFGRKASKRLSDVHHELARRKKLQGLEASTLTKLDSNYNKLVAYAGDFVLADVDDAFILEFEGWMRGRENRDSTIYKSLCYLKEILTYAIGKKYLDGKENPFDDYPLDRGNFTPARLTLEEYRELRKLHDEGLVKPAWQKLLRKFLFACCTGLSFADVCTLRRNVIVRVTALLNGEEVTVPCIDTRRVKGKKGYFVPIVPEAQSLIDLSAKDGELLFDLTTEQATNRLLKKIAAHAGIDRRITFHVARHTFASLSVNFGIREEIVTKELGQTKPSMTKHYARLDETTIVREMMEKFRT